MELVVRDARPGEGRRFEEIRIAGWRAAYTGLMDPTFLAALVVDEERVARRERWIGSPVRGEVMLVADAGGVVVGGAFLLPCRDDDVEDTAELAALYVDPDVRGSGAGSALLDAGLDRMSEPRQVLWTLEGNVPARRFYERRGFVLDGARKLLDVPGRPYEVRYRRSRPTSALRWP